MIYIWDVVDVIVFSLVVKEGVFFVKKEYDIGRLSFCLIVVLICCNLCIGWKLLLFFFMSKILLFCIGIVLCIFFIISLIICGCVLKGCIIENEICGYWFFIFVIFKGILCL